MNDTTLILVVIVASIVAIVAVIALFVMNKRKKIQNVQKEFHEIFQIIEENEKAIEENRKTSRNLLVNATLNCQSNTALAEELSAIIKKIEEDSDMAIALNKEVREIVMKVYYRHPTLKDM